MTDFLSRTCVAFAGSRRVASGPLKEVALAAKALESREEDVLVFDDISGAVVDIDLRGDTSEILRRLQEQAAASSDQDRPEPRREKKRGRGRPKLGVVPREVTLLPRHWEWLGAQPGGASQALRRLVDQARRADGAGTRMRAARDAAYRFMTVMAGDRPGFEEAARALFANDRARLAEQASSWPEDVRAYVLERAFVDREADGSS